MMQNMRQGIPRIFKQGTKHTHGVEEAILKNIEACQELTEMTRTSLGPNGACFFSSIVVLGGVVAR